MKLYDAAIPAKLGPLTEGHRLVVLKGGRGGGKTIGVCRVLLMKALASKILILCLREFMNSIADSTHRTLTAQIEELGMKEEFEILKSTILCKRTGSQIIFSGMNHPESVQSLYGCDVVFYDEAQRCSQRSLDILLPTVRKENSQIIFSLNPHLPTDPVWKQLILGKDNYKDCVVVDIEWMDNPWFPTVLSDEKDACLRQDVEKYNNIWLGHTLERAECVIFNRPGQIQSYDFTPDPALWQPFFGADWGSVDPTVLVKTWVWKEDLYVEYETYDVDIPIELITASWDLVPGSANQTIYADNSRPEIIKYLRRNGLPHLRPCKKWPGSILDGIDHLKNFQHIIVHPRCTHTLEEFSSYKWKTRKLGDTEVIIPDEPEDKNNHCCDAIRYSQEPIILGRKQHMSDRQPAPELDSLGNPIIPGRRNPLARSSTWL
jgi:phage terminase large subunit